MHARLAGLARKEAEKQAGETTRSGGPERCTNIAASKIFKRHGAAHWSGAEPCRRATAIVPGRTFDGLDVLGRFEMKQLITTLRKQKKTIFFNSHILSESKNYATVWALSIVVNC